MDKVLARINSLFTDEVSRFMMLSGNDKYLHTDFSRFSDKAVEAIKTRASMAELKRVSGILEDHFVDKDTISRIAPFSEMSRRYADAGYNINSAAGLREMKAGMNVWELYNKLTDYASNNKDWKPKDPRRGYLQHDALNFLMTARDIKHYQDLFLGVDKEKTYICDY